MAERAGRGRAKPAAAAKGAKAESAAKTRERAAAAAENTGTTASGDGRVVTPQDNERAAWEAEQAQLLSIVNQIMAQQRTVAAAKATYEELLAEIKAPFDAAKARELELFRLAKAATFERQQIEAYIADMKLDTREREKKRKLEARHRDMLGIGAQGDLFGESTPVEVRDEAYWKSEGYLLYHRGEQCKAPPQCPQRFVQAVLTGWHDAEALTIMAMGKATPAAAGAALPQADPPADDDEDETDREDLGDTMLDAIAEVEPELVAQVIEDHGEEAERIAGMPVTGELADGTKIVGDDFEASEDELAAQTGRQVIQQQREAAADEAV